MARPGDVCGPDDPAVYLPDGTPIHPNALENLRRNNPDHPLVAGDGGGDDDDGGGAAAARSAGAGDSYYEVVVTIGCGDYAVIATAAARLGVKPDEVLRVGGLERAHKIIAGLVREPGPA